jgi:tetraacyldisaccharide 4'-kinase
MKTPAFWDEVPPSPWARLLSPVGAIYGAITAARMRKPGMKTALPVICIGNLTAGGAGKTPTVLALAAILHTQGHKPVALSRGYGGSLAGPVLVDPALHLPSDVGDEPLLLAQVMPTIITRDRVAGAALASLHGNVIVMDDGLQNPSLVKSLRIAVIDGGSGIGNGLCLPAGPLRAPLAQQWPHVDHVLIIGTGTAGDDIAALAIIAGKPVSRAVLVPEPRIAATLVGRPVLALSGIGRPEKFRQTLVDLGAQVVAEMRFADHRAYTEQDVAAISAKAKICDALVVTTEKDAVKLAALWREAEHGPLAIMPVTLAFSGDSTLAQAALKAAQQH